MEGHGENASIGGDLRNKISGQLLLRCQSGGCHDIASLIIQSMLLCFDVSPKGDVEESHSSGLSESPSFGAEDGHISLPNKLVL